MPIDKIMVTVLIELIDESGVVQAKDRGYAVQGLIPDVLPSAKDTACKLLDEWEALGSKGKRGSKARSFGGPQDDKMGDAAQDDKGETGTAEAVCSEEAQPAAE